VGLGRRPLRQARGWGTRSRSPSHPAAVRRLLRLNWRCRFTRESCGQTSVGRSHPAAGPPVCTAGVATSAGVPDGARCDPSEGAGARREAAVGAPAGGRLGGGARRGRRGLRATADRGLSRAARRRRQLRDTPPATCVSAGHATCAAPAQPIGAAGAQPLLGLSGQTQAARTAACAADAGAAVPARTDDRAVSAGHLAAPDAARVGGTVSRPSELWRCAKRFRATCR